MYDAACTVDVLVAAFVDGIVHILCCHHPVIRLDLGDRVAVAVHPLDALADVERPDRHILIGRPAFGKSGNGIAVLVIVDQVIHQIRAQCIIHLNVRLDVVQRGDLTVVDDIIDALLLIGFAALVFQRRELFAASAKHQQAQDTGSEA